MLKGNFLTFIALLNVLTFSTVHVGQAVETRTFGVTYPSGAAGGSGGGDGGDNRNPYNPQKAYSGYLTPYLDPNTVWTIYYRPNPTSDLQSITLSYTDVQGAFIYALGRIRDANRDNNWGLGLLEGGPVKHNIEVTTAPDTNSQIGTIAVPLNAEESRYPLARLILDTRKNMAVIGLTPLLMRQDHYRNIQEMMGINDAPSNNNARQTFTRLLRYVFLREFMRIFGVFYFPVRGTQPEFPLLPMFAEVVEIDQDNSTPSVATTTANEFFIALRNALGGEDVGDDDIDFSDADKEIIRRLSHDQCRPPYSLSTQALKDSACQGTQVYPGVLRLFPILFQK